MHDHLPEVLREFTRTIINPFDVDDLLDRLISQAVATLDAAGAGIMLVDRRGELDFAAASSDAVAALERVQERIETGACYEAFTTNRLIVVENLPADRRWPEYTSRAVKFGFASVIGVPLEAWGESIGVLNIYRATPGTWTPDDIEASEILAAMGAAYILQASRLQAQQSMAESLQAALDSRGIIERAKGILMEREDIDAATAFKTLRKMSMDTNCKLRDVAGEIVEARG